MVMIYTATECENNRFEGEIVELKNSNFWAW